jgi:hypothetical protein
MPADRHRGGRVGPGAGVGAEKNVWVGAEGGRVGLADGPAFVPASIEG